MPAADADLRDEPASVEADAGLPFPPVTRSHILHCSVHFWHPLFRTLTPKTRLVPLSAAFIGYLRSDGIMLPEEPHSKAAATDSDSDWDDSDSESSPQHDPSDDWPEVHAAVQATIKELGGKVHPKLNWSAPKDATWMIAGNTMTCTSANDVYLLLKSSDFVTHDLEQVFDGCVPEEPALAEHGQRPDIPYHLVLRKSIASVVTSMEFRCFVKDQHLIAICQRELIHYAFLPDLLPTLQQLIGAFFEEHLRPKFPDPNYTFDVYIPQPKERGRVWLIDINPWAPRTDPLLYSWMELLTDMPRLPSDEGQVSASDAVSTSDADENAPQQDVEEVPPGPEFRVVKRDDPEAYSLSSPLYSAHKLPKEVVDAGLEGPSGIREFLERWKDIEKRAGENASSDEGE